MHIAFWNIPALGHIYPTLSTVAELTRRGHRVSYAATPARRSLIEATGATLVPYQSSRPADTDPDPRRPDPKAFLADSLLSFLTEARFTLPQIEPFFADKPPDVVVYDRISFAGRIFAAKHNLPAVQSWPMLVSNEHWSLFDARDFDPTHPTYLAYEQQLAQFLADNGLDIAPADFFTTPQPRRELCYFPRSFQYKNELFDGRYRFVGPCPRDTNSSWRASDDDRPILLISLGTVDNHHPDFYRMCLRAFGDTHWRVIIAIGERFDPKSLGPVPANIDIQPVVPLPAVLRHTTVLLCHAGMGSVMEAVAMAVPLVTIPRTAEQRANAERIAELGIGSWLAPTELTDTALRDTVERVAKDDALGARMRTLCTEALAAGGASAAADVIEELAC